MDKIDAALDIIRTMTDEERERLLSRFADDYCHHCGQKQPEKTRCQCWNDE